MTDEQLAGLQAKHGRIKHVIYNGTDLVFRKPKRVECQMHAAKLEAGGPEKASADEQLAQLLIVVCGEKQDTEAKRAFLDLLDEYPYLVRNEKVGGALAKLTGVTQDDEAKIYGSASTGSATPHTSTPVG